MKRRGHVVYKRVDWRILQGLHRGVGVERKKRVLTLKNSSFKNFLSHLCYRNVIATLKLENHKLTPFISKSQKQRKYKTKMSLIIVF